MHRLWTGKMHDCVFFSKEESHMFQKERMDAIVDILKQNGYVTVKYLKEELHYSNATVNRDLNLLEKQNLVKRSYGGVELVEPKNVPLLFRYHKMKSAKNKIGQKAAEYVRDGDTIFVDASTTTEYMGRHLIDKKDITVITNNMALVMLLSEYNIRTICLGGEVMEKPSMLYSDETVENARHYHADKMFFSSGSFTADGKIGSGVYYQLHRVMLENADQCFYLVDHEKFNQPFRRMYSFAEVDYIITDYQFEDSLKEKFEKVEFVEV